MVEHVTDAVVGKAGAAGRRQRPAVGARVLLVRPPKHLERGTKVRSRARERAGDGKDRRSGRSARWRWDVATHRDDIERRFVAVDTTEMGGNADRAAKVAPWLEVAQACRDHGGPAASRTARRPRRIPRVVGGSEDRVVTLPVAGPERHVGLAQDHGTSLTQARHHHGVARRDMTGQRRGSRRRPHTGDLVRVLDGARHAVERPPPLAPGACFVRRPRPGERSVRGQCDDGVEPRVVPLDAVERARGQLYGGDVAPANGARRRERGREVEFLDRGSGAARRKQTGAGQREAAGQPRAPSQGHWRARSTSKSVT
jgi:hypothetical protein